MLEGKLLGGRYQILDKVGSGGMAEVFRGTDTVLGRTVAIKMMLPQYAKDPAFAARFRQEAQAAAALSSPYIVGIYDWGMDGDTYYIIMEYLRGTDLKSGIKQHGPLATRKAAQIGAQVCAALTTAHKHEIIHRDIKPQNIMIQPDGSSKVMDFGIARAKNSHLTQTNSVLGTAHYVSPEQTQGKELGPESDIYSLGVVLYECVTGKVPFDGDSAVTVALKQVNEAPIPPSQLNPKVDHDFEQIILKCMNKDPEQRFKTADELRRVLNSYIQGRPISIGGVGPSATQMATTAIPAANLGSTKTSVMPAQNINAASKTSPHSRGAQGYAQAKQDEDAAKRKRNIIIGVSLFVAIALIGIIAFAVTQCNKNADTRVPNVLGLTLEQAEQSIKASGFEIGDVSTEFSETEKGKVIDQDPVANMMKPKGSKINLVISGGTEPPKEVAVPDISNLTAAEAEAKIKEAGLIPQAGESVFDEQVEVGRVVSQSPAAGATVKEGDTITYVTSKGVESIEIPDVIGSSQADATQTLEAAGFSVSVKESQSDKAKGTVIAVDPKAGGKADRGSTVTITVSTGKKLVEVPSVIGLSEGDATAKLKNAGLKVSINPVSQSGSGKVVGQSERGGSKVDPGTTVTIDVDKSAGDGSGE